MRPILQSLILITAIALVMAGQARAQADQNPLPVLGSEDAPAIRIENLGLAEGLTQGTVYSFMQDRHGFVWFGTQGGLHRYDGSTFKVYEPVAFDSTSITSGWVFSLTEGRDGSIWAGTFGNGLDRLNPKTGKFDHFKPDPDDSTSVPGSIVATIYEASDGTLWVSTDNGVARMNPERPGVFDRFPHVHGDTTTVAGDAVPSVREDPDGFIWLGTDDGLVRIDPQSREVTNYFNNGEHSFADSGAFFFNIVDRQDPYVFWYGTGRGIARFDTRTQEIERFVPYPNEPEGFPSNGLAQLAWDPNEADVIWTQSPSGLLRLNISTGRFDRYENDPGDPNSLASNQVQAVFADRSGTMWVGYGNKGIGRFNPKSVAIRHISANPDRPREGLPEGNIWAMHASDDYLWVGVAEVNNQTLVQFDLATGEVKQTRSTQNDPNTLWPEGSIQSILLDSQGTLWVGTSGLNRCTPGELRCERIPRQTAREDSSHVWWNTIHSIYEAPDEPGVLWLGGIGRGLQRYDVASGTVTNFAQSRTDPAVLPGSISHALIASDGGLWLASLSGGIGRLDRETGAMDHFPYNERDTLGVASGQIETILELDSQPGVLWLATQAGLDRFDMETRTVRHFNEDRGLANNHIYGVLEGDDGQLWMSSNRGISAFDPETETFRNYGLDDGLRELEFMQNAWTRGPGGMLYFGDVSGIVSFAPSRLNTNPMAPSIAFTGLRVNGREVIPSEDGVLRAPITETGSIELEYSQNDFSVDFVALHFSDPSRNQYAYRLEGYDEDWIDAGLSRSASFTNLPPGTYTLRVRAANPDGVWNEEGISLGVTVLPPWYRTAWAYVLFALILAGGVFAVDRIQRRRLLKAERARADLAEIQLRAEAAESEARALQADNERKQNIERLSDIGKEITASLDFETIFGRVYHHINDMTDAPVFGVGIYHPEAGEIEYRMAIENGQRYRPYTRDTKDKNQLPVWCIENRAPVFINDVESEYSKYVEHIEQESGVLEDGSAAKQPNSMIYLPLLTQDRILGVITVQSFKKNAYTQNDLNLLQTISAYASVALDNANAYRQLNGIVAELRETQQQLVHQEKMASLGQLTAGIAHEIKNPLNFVNNFADVNAELAGELRDLLEGKDTADLAAKREEMEELISSLQLNSQQIAKHGRRADDIVRGMMAHARTGNSEKLSVDVNGFMTEYVNLAWHGYRARYPGLKAQLERDFSPDVGAAKLAPQDLGRVIINLVGNALDEVRNKDDGHILVSTHHLNDRIEIRVADNGRGISAELQAKIFEPFFTTKPTGEGTGLGLSMAHDIVTQGHGGTMRVENNADGGATFVICLPLAEAQ